MVDNIGLGEAIAGGTSLKGDTGAPITRGLMLKNQNELRRMQLEQQKALREQQKAEKMGKFLSQPKADWFNPENATKFGEYYKTQLPKLMEAHKVGDVQTAAELQNEIVTQLGMMKAIDNDEKVLTAKSKTHSGQIAKEIYSKEGVAGLAKDAENYPVPVASVDERTGSFSVNEYKDPYLNVRLEKGIRDALKSTYGEKYVGPRGSAPVYQVDKNDPEYLKMKQAVIDNIVKDENTQLNIMASRDFRKFFDDYAAAHPQMPRQMLKDVYVGDIFKDYITEKYNSAENATGMLRTGGSVKSGGGKGNPLWYVGGKTSFSFEPHESGGRLVNTSGVGDASVTLRGISEGEEAEFKFTNPRVTYVGGNNFLINGAGADMGGYKTDRQVTASPSQIKSAFGLTDAGLKHFFGYQPVSRGGAKAKSTDKWKDYKRSANKK